MRKKQVILIMTDTTRKDMLGCYGNTTMITPHLDKLAQQGIRYDRAYTTQPVCGPARSALFTGLMPHSNGMIANSMALGENVITIGKRLSDKGYTCAYIGKWHLDGGDYFGNGVCPDGYDKNYWYDMKMYLDELTPQERMKSRDFQTAYDEKMDETFTYAHRCTDRAIDFLTKNQNEDFFLTVSYDEPHDPSLCPEPYNHMYDGVTFPKYPSFSDTLEGKPFYQKLWADNKLNAGEDEVNTASDQLALYLGCNSFVDHEIGRILDVLESFPDALIIFTSDHGNACGEHKLNAKGASIYESIAGIPLIIKGGEHGKVSNMPVSLLDITPTILEYMGIQIPKILQGKSILKNIYDTTSENKECIFCEFTRYEVDHDGFGGLQMMRAVMNERYKLAIHLLDTDELYDNLLDPYELDNLIERPEYRDIRNELHDQILHFMNTSRDPYRGYQWCLRPWRKDMQISWRNDGYTRQRENEVDEPRQLDYDTGLEMVDAVRKKITK